MNQILSELTGFCGRYDKKHFGVFFRFTVYISFKASFLLLATFLVSGLLSSVELS